MTSTTDPTDPTHLTLRPYAPQDEADVLELIRADRLPGQPPTTGAMLTEALAGRSPADIDWWEELDPPTTTVAAAGADGRVVGVVSHALRRKDDTGLLLWLHCREDPYVARELTDHVLRAFGPRAVDAFHITSALSLGLECLPVGHRPATRAALEAAGFAVEPRWRYLHRDLPAPELPRAEGVTRQPGMEHDPGSRRLVVGPQQAPTAEALFTAWGNCGALWWISVEEHAQGRGLGRRILGSALATLADSLGARQVILLLDASDDATEQEVRDRTAAAALYARAGFTDVDRLDAFTRPAA